MWENCILKIFLKCDYTSLVKSPVCIPNLIWYTWESDISLLNSEWSLGSKDTGWVDWTQSCGECFAYAALSTKTKQNTDLHKTTACLRYKWNKQAFHLHNWKGQPMASDPCTSGMEAEGGGNLL